MTTKTKRQHSDSADVPLPKRARSSPGSSTGASSTQRFEPLLQLIVATEVHTALQSKSPPHIIEAVTSRDVADRPCIPGAVPLDVCTEIERAEEDGPNKPKHVEGNYSLLPAPELRRALEAAGVRHDQMVVVYTENMRGDAIDLAPAFRLAWTLCFAGCRHVALLTGGVRAWVAAGLTPAKGYSPRSKVDFFDGRGLPFPQCPHLLVSTQEVESIVAAGEGSTAKLADVRTWAEYTGKSHNYPYHVPLGRIPHARWAHWGTKTYEGDAYYSTATGALKPLADTAAMWRKEGLEPSGERRVVFYCGSGWRAALAWCLCRLHGHDGCAVYDGSILEWAVFSSRAAEHALVRGPPSPDGPTAQSGVECAAHVLATYRPDFETTARLCLLLQQWRRRTAEQQQRSEPRALAGLGAETQRLMGVKVTRTRSGRCGAG